jgi:hypothetical protein
MENRGLLFIPDISGFTKFINETEIEHSRMIIQELLEVLIASNTSGLKISEIEGDAILFYKFGEPPPLKQIYTQVHDMFCAFHAHLIAYDHHRYCYCQACNSAIALTLKIITHYGEFTGYRVQQFDKLLGKDVIVAHQLLKNEISNHEYWLVTDNVTSRHDPETMEDWMQWDKKLHVTDSGQLQFHYTYLEALKSRVKPQVSSSDVLKNARKLLTFDQQLETDIITAFHLTGDFNNRSKWQDGVIRVEEVSHALPRVGMKCRKIMDTGESIVYVNNYYYSEEHIEFVEVEEGSKYITQYVLERIDDLHTAFSITVYSSARSPSLAWYLGGKRKKEESIKKSMQKLASMVNQMNEEQTINSTSH